MSDILVTMNLQEKEFLAKALIAKRAAEQIGMAIDVSGQKASTAAAAQKTQFSGVVAQAGQAALAFVGVGSALAAIQKAGQMIVAEYQNMLTRKSEGAATHTRLADAQFEMYAATDRGAHSGLDKRVADISMRTMADQATVYRAMANALGASQGMDISGRFGSLEEFADAAVSATAKLNPLDEKLAIYQSGGVVDVMKAFPGLKDIQGTLGMLITTQKLSRVNDPESFFKHGIKGIAQGAAYGMTPQESMGLNAALSSLGVDFTNRPSSTAQGGFMKQVSEAIGVAISSNKAPADLAQKSWFDKLNWIATASQSGDKTAIAIRERMLGVSADTLIGKGPIERKTRKKLDTLRYGVDDLSELTSEQQHYVAVRGMLTAGSPQHKMLKDFIAAVGGEAKGSETYNSLVEALSRSTIQQVARAQRAAQTATTAAHIREPGEAIQGAILEELPKLERALGVSALGQIIDKFKMAISGSEPMDKVISDTIRVIRDREPAPYNRLWNGGSEVDEAEADKIATPEERYTHETIKQITNHLEVLRKTVEDNRFKKPEPPQIEAKGTIQQAARAEVESAREIIRQIDAGGAEGRKAKLLRDVRGLTNPNGGGWSLQDDSYGPYNPFNLREYDKPDAEGRVLRKMRERNKKLSVPLRDDPGSVPEKPGIPPYSPPNINRNRGAEPPPQPAAEKKESPVEVKVSIHDPIGRELTRVSARRHPLREIG